MFWSTVTPRQLSVAVSGRNRGTVPEKLSPPQSRRLDNAAIFVLSLLDVEDCENMGECDEEVRVRKVHSGTATIRT